MKRLIFLFLLFTRLLAHGQQSTPHIFVLNKDTLYKKATIAVTANWRFKETDSLNLADTGYDDSKWQIVNSMLDEDEGQPMPTKKFNGIGWFRLHIIADSNIVNVPVSLNMMHFGASEIYLDGEKINSFGLINGKDSTIAENPLYLPFIVSFKWPGNHVIAVRYANFYAKSNRKKYSEDMAGFQLKIATTTYDIHNHRQVTVSLTFILTLLFGIFIALSIAHLFLFLYHRSAKSNLYFSLFCAMFALLYLLPWFGFVSSNPFMTLSQHYTIPVLMAGVCFSLSGFVNSLFSISKKRFLLIGLLCLAAPISFWFSQGVGIGMFFTITISVMLEATVLIIQAIYRKTKGAKIIGIGVLLFTLFILVTTLYLLFFQHISFNGESAWEEVFLLFTALAVLSLPISMSLYLAWNFAAVNKHLKENLEQVKELSEKSIAQELEKNKIVESQNEKLEQEVAIRTAEVVIQKEKIEKQHDELKEEKQKSDKLLLNILPEEVAMELKEKGFSEAKSFNDVTVLFTDFVNFTAAGEHMTPQELVDELHICFKTFDEICAQYGIEKIKTIGDAYLAVCGLPLANLNHALNTVNAAIDILAFMNTRKLQLKDKTFDVRIGIHSGNVVAGIVGIKKFAYDIWGDTVNTAARMEQSGEAGKINISGSTYQLVQNHFHCTDRGMIQAKNKGELNMYFVEGKK